MSNTLKIAKIGLWVSAVALVLAAAVMVIAGFEWPQITTVCGIFCVFCANLTIYLSAKKKEEDGKKDE